MKIKAGTLQVSIQALNELAKTPLPAVTAYKVSRLLKQVAGLLTDWDATRQALAQRLAVRNDDGSLLLNEQKQMRIADEHRDEFNTETAALMNLEMDIDVTPIGVGELGTAMVSPQLFGSLDWLFPDGAASVKG